jgi:hypothetical protein
VTGLQAVAFTLLSLLGRDAPDDALVLGAPLLEVVLAVVGVTWRRWPRAW